MCAGPNLEGRLRLDQIWATDGAEHTWDLSNVPGEITVERPYFRNTNVGCPRISGNTVIRNCTMVKDAAHPAQQWSDGRAIRIWVTAATAHGAGPVEIADCDLWWTESGGAERPIHAVQPTADNALEVRDTRIHNATPKAPIYTGGGTVELRLVTINGAGPDPSIAGTIDRCDMGTVDAPAPVG